MLALVALLALICGLNLCPILMRAVLQAPQHVCAVFCQPTFSNGLACKTPLLCMQLLGALH